MIHKIKNGDGVEIKTISLSTHCTIVASVTTVLLTVIGFLGGYSFGAATIKEHADIVGHPIMVERVGHITESLEELKATAKRIETKLDTHDRNGG